MKTLKRKYMLLPCLALSLAASAAGFAVASPMAAKAESLVSENMQMEIGAGLYLNEVSGLKFSYTVKEYDETANYGMLIVPYDYLDDAGITDLTDENNDYVNALLSATLPNQPVIVENLKPNDEGIFAHSITEIYEHNYVRSFFAVGFEKTGENTYVYAKQDNNVRSVFEVANLALNKLHFGQWGDTEKELLYKAKLDKYSGNEDGEENTQDDILDNFIVKGFAFVYGKNATISVENIATSVNGAVAPTLVLPEKQKPIDLPLHVNYEVEDDAIATVSKNGELQGLARGQSTVTASLGGVINVETQVAVLKDATELTLYKNGHKADFFAVDGKISLSGGFYDSSSNNTEEVSGNRANSMGYVAFEDTYTLDEKGTYIDIYFQGNNMPSVEFFATDVNAYFMDAYANDGKGFIVNNGFASSTSNRENSTSRFGGYAAYSGYFDYGVSAYNDRWIGAEGYHLGARPDTKEGSAKLWDYRNSREITQAYSLFSMYSLAHAQAADQNYRYTVGMYKDADGYVWIDAALYKVDQNGKETTFTSWTGKALIEGQTNSVKQDKLNDGEVISGKIVLHAAAKGLKKDESKVEQTVFTCSAPYKGRFESKDATFNADGTVSLKNGTNGGSLSQITNSVGYIALAGEYGLGTYVDFYFTGSNLPQVSFFNEYITNNLSATYKGVAETNSGILLINDMRYSAMGIVGNAYYRFTVLPRLTKGFEGATKYHTDGSNSNAASKMSASVLETMPEQRFKYTVGFYLGEGDKIYVSIDVDKLDANGNKTEDYFTLNQDLSAKLSKADIKGNRIIVYGAVSGNVNATTTFSYSKPYTK